jgi:hypothetical protein
VPAEPAKDSQLSLPLPGLTAVPSNGLGIPRANRVFVNRDLNMSSIDWVGFDMDYTLAIYKQEQMDALSIELTIERMIRRGYPKHLKAGTACGGSRARS